MKNRIVLSVIGKARKYWVNRKYKDRIFRMVFRNKEDLLSLYNAINGTAYTNPNDLIIRTLEDAVYLGYKNDLSFLISNTLNLYEHQSTVNPNMPLRGLLYFTDMFKAYIAENKYNIYGTKLVPLPIPRYIVFYNGADEQPDMKELRLSDAYDDAVDKDAALECKATMLNINWGHNQEIMDRCQRLEEYAYFVACVHRYLDLGYHLEIAIDYAIEECIEKDKIADILEKNRAEVKNLLLTDFDEKKYRKMIKEEAREEGFEKGREEGREEGRREGREEGIQNITELNRRLFQDQRLDDLKRSLEDEKYQMQLMKEYGIE